MCIQGRYYYVIAEFGGLEGAGVGGSGGVGLRRPRRTVYGRAEGKLGKKRNTRLLLGEAEDANGHDETDRDLRSA